VYAVPNATYASGRSSPSSSGVQPVMRALSTHGPVNTNSAPTRSALGCRTRGISTMPASGRPRNAPASIDLPFSSSHARTAAKYRAPVGDAFSAAMSSAMSSS
jgi:hypothetical protein